MAKEVVKKRHWAFVLYPESAPTEWRTLLAQSGVQAAISPLHDKDVNPTGERKKAHYHIILVYPGPTTATAVGKVTSSLNATIPIPLEAVKGMYRYLTHRDNPEKAQYREEDIETLGGFNIADLCELTRSEVNEIKIRIQVFVKEHDILEYSELMDLLLELGMYAEYDVACNNTFFFDRYICSRRNARYREERG